MSDYNDNLLPDPCLRLDYGFGEQWNSVELGDGTGYVRLADYEKVASENEKLREELARARDPQRIDGRMDPESFVYAIDQLREFRWQHATNDEDAIPYINNVVAARERETAKLRELVKNMHGWLVVNYEKSYVIPLNGLNDIERDMRELGLVDDE